MALWASGILGRSKTPEMSLRNSGRGTLVSPRNLDQGTTLCVVTDLISCLQSSHLLRHLKNCTFAAPKLVFLSFFLYILPGARFRALSAGVHCTLRVAGWKPLSNHIEITLGFFNLHRRWLSLHRGHPVNVPIRRTMHLSSVIPANDTRESVFRHRNFSRRKLESNLGPLAPEASA